MWKNGSPRVPYIEGEIYGELNSHEIQRENYKRNKSCPISKETLNR